MKGEKNNIEWRKQKNKRSMEEEEKMEDRGTIERDQRISK